MSPATVGRVIDDLLKESLVELEEPPNPGAIGRPLKNVRLDSTTPRFVLIEVGPRFTRVAAAPADFRSVTEWHSEHPTPTSAKEWKEWFSEAYFALKLRSKPDAIILSVPGIIDERDGRALLSPNLHWVVGFDFEANINAVVKTQVRLVQEVRALARGFIANSTTPSSFLLVDFGTGLGATAVINGQLYRGALPLGGEIGHTPVEGHSQPCNCGGRGCLETIMGRPHLLNIAKIKDLKDFGASIEQDGVPPWFAERLEATGHVIGGALNTLGLNNVVLTGYFDDLPLEAVEKLSEAIRQSTLWARFGRIHVQRAPRQRLSGLASTCLDRMMEGLVA
ncbi:hypothetical protein ASG47_07095 [Devosia sp. Leaf420]|uniref:ROK family protein n=1 Tax=Devosia sp. Leaf420 TaxID=1736374 RepID=UPI0007143F02|nr:ROK family protein [Devosia sp. Leaf420]KQT48132.1 hypothetical protein ASG47_07095 [Devosia sp. Leaf420]